MAETFIQCDLQVGENFERVDRTNSSVQHICLGSFGVALKLVSKSYFYLLPLRKQPNNNAQMPSQTSASFKKNTLLTFKPLNPKCSHEVKMLRIWGNET